MLVYKEGGREAYLGDVFELSYKDVENDAVFFNSTIGKVFKDEVCDKLEITIKQWDWLEIYFELTLYKDGRQLKEHEVWQCEEYDGENYTEYVDYRFFRYLIVKGLKKAKGV